MRSWTLCTCIATSENQGGQNDHSYPPTDNKWVSNTILRQAKNTVEKLTKNLPINRTPCYSNTRESRTELRSPPTSQQKLPLFWFYWTPLLRQKWTRSKFKSFQAFGRFFVCISQIFFHFSDNLRTEIISIFLMWLIPFLLFSTLSQIKVNMGKRAVALKCSGINHMIAGRQTNTNHFHYLSSNPKIDIFYIFNYE